MRLFDPRTLNRIPSGDISNKQEMVFPENYFYAK